MVTDLEKSMIDAVHEKTQHELTKRIPAISAIDYRRVMYCLIEDRLAIYKQAGFRRTFDEVLTEFGIAKQTYYNWFEKYNRDYKQCKKDSETQV